MPRGLQLLLALQVVGRDDGRLAAGLAQIAHAQGDDFAGRRHRDGSDALHKP